MSKYEETFGHLRDRFLMTRAIHRCLLKQTDLSVMERAKHLLEYEIGLNLDHDHFHPEIAGPLQQAVFYLDCLAEVLEKQGKGGTNHGT